MRTTWEIDDDVLAQVKEYAAARSISNGAAASEMLRRSFDADIPTKWENGLLIFAPTWSEPITPEQAFAMKDALEDEW